MPRVTRGLADGGIYHVLNRGNGRQRVFHKDEDFAAFINLLGQAKERHPVKILSYCLIQNSEISKFPEGRFMRVMVSAVFILLLNTFLPERCYSAYVCWTYDYAVEGVDPYYGIPACLDRTINFWSDGTTTEAIRTYYYLYYGDQKLPCNLGNIFANGKNYGLGQTAWIPYQGGCGCDANGDEIPDGSILGSDGVPKIACGANSSCTICECIPAAEICDGVDNDCDGLVDEGAKSIFYYDADRDGYGGPGVTQACTAPAGYVGISGDCNDSDASIHPGAAEVCGDGKDNNCNYVSDCIDSACSLSVNCNPPPPPAGGGCAEIPE